MTKRFSYKENKIIDEYTKYEYVYADKEDFIKLCGLLNQIHDTLTKTLEW